MISGPAGTEKAFRKVGKLNPDILHLATHSFYYAEDNSVVMMDRLFGANDCLWNVDNPMLRSGLIFSKPQKKEASSANDGIITANEISAMDFSGVDLVVLSSCQSGMGDLREGEGVFGLQRAFKMAGARKLIVSLWKVPDKATAELMIKFYEYYMNGENITNSLKKAQMFVREEYPEPFYWGGFYVVS